MLKIGIPVTWQLVIILGMSLIAGKANQRFTCMAYSVPLTYILEKGLSSIVSQDIHFNVDYKSFIFLIGMLHIIEGILTSFYGYEENESIVTYKEDKIAGGYKLYRKWSIPLFLFVYKGIYLPILAVLVYADESFTMFPKQKAHKMGGWITVYGVSICILYLLHREHYLMLFEIMLLMPLGHEAIFIINRIYEKGRLIYDYPIRGIRVLESQEKKNSLFKKGDIILKVNDREVSDDAIYYHLIDEADQLIIQILTLDGQYKKVYCSKDKLKEQGIVLLPKE